MPAIDTAARRCPECHSTALVWYALRSAGCRGCGWRGYASEVSRPRDYESSWVARWRRASRYGQRAGRHVAAMALHVEYDSRR